VKTLKEHNEEMRRMREQFKRLGGRRTGLECNHCGNELIEVPQSQNSPLDATQWVRCDSCGRRDVMDQPCS
jgi:uncharacterized protein with PIN domain